MTPIQSALERARALRAGVRRLDPMLPRWCSSYPVLLILDLGYRLRRRIVPGTRPPRPAADSDRGQAQVDALRQVSDLREQVSDLREKVVAILASRAPAGDSGGALDREAIRREAARICDERWFTSRGPGVDRPALALAVSDCLVDAVEREVRVALDRAGEAQDRAERDARELHEENFRLRRRVADLEGERELCAENVRLRERVAQLEDSAQEAERAREEDQRRRDELDRYPGAGAG